MTKSQTVTRGRKQRKAQRKASGGSRAKAAQAAAAESGSCAGRSRTEPVVVASVPLSQAPLAGPSVEGVPSAVLVPADDQVPPAGITVRSATVADAPAVSALWIESTRRIESAGPEWALVDGAAERHARGVQAAVGNPRNLYLIAETEVDGQRVPAGFLHASVKLRSPLYRESVMGEIQAIHVTSDTSGRGVGSALVAAAMDWMGRRGIAHVETSTAALDASGQSFWRRMGFQESALVFRAAVPACAQGPTP